MHCSHCGCQLDKESPVGEKRCPHCDEDFSPISPVLPMPDFGGNGFDPGSSDSGGGDVGDGGFGGGDFGGGGAGGSF